MRPSAASPTLSPEVRQFADAVAVSLAATPRRLPSAYFYDALGSALFDAIGQLPWYPITRAELALLEAHAGTLLTCTGPLDLIVELGPGNGAKLAVVARALSRPCEVHLVDVSPAALDAAARALEVSAGISPVKHHATYEAGLAIAAAERRGDGSMLTLFLGSNIGNFEPLEADRLLSRVREEVRSGDWLALGTDLVKPEPELLLAYDDPLEVTAAFNRNLLVRCNRELGADFAVGAFTHRAVWNTADSRVEMHLVSAHRQRVVIPAADLDLTFEAGEAIWTESSHKYQPEGVNDLLRRAGFRSTAQWERAGFALTLAEAV